MEQNEIFMQRCLQLASLGAGKVAPNPMVGALLVHNGRIIGEGYHMQYGGPHAEPNCIAGVAKADRHLIADSVMYVSLEPCAHFGKTPPCADLLIRHQIKKVVVGCRDPFEAVNGKGIEKLREAGVDVTIGVLENECVDLNKFFFVFNTKKRPYIIVKWAQTSDGFIGASEHDCESRVLITSEITNRLVHKWRSQTASVLVGTNTALKDDPALTTRLWSGSNAVRIVIDRNLRLTAGAKLLNDEAPTIVFNDEKCGEAGTVTYHKLNQNTNIVQQVLEVLYQKKINSLLVEGGAKTLQSFIDAKLWDEARIITNRNMYLHDGVKAPVLQHGKWMGKENYGDDEVAFWVHQ